MRWLSIILMLLCTFCGATIAEDSGDALRRAIDEYQSALDQTDRNRRVQLFSRAETLFAAVIEARRSETPDVAVSPDLYVNQGNAALGAEHLGAAILAYRRALSVDPNHRTARQNLEHARTLLPDWVPTPESRTAAFGSIFEPLHSIGRSEWYGIAAIAFAVMAVLVAIFFRTGKSSVRNVALAVGLIWLFAIVRPLWYEGDGDASVAVVVVPEVTARSADSINSPARFRDPLPSGAEVLIVEDRGDWNRVQMFDGREAWLPVSSIEFVRRAPQSDQASR